MFDGRHCVEADYALLNKETDKIIKILLSGDKTPEKELNDYLRLISRFDLEISESLKYKLSINNLTPSQMVNIINQYIDVLKQQVLVDIREHN